MDNELKIKKVKKHEIDMCSGNLFKKIIIFSLPLAAMGMLQLFYNTGSIVWFVGNVKYKGSSGDEEDETSTNFYNSIRIRSNTTPKTYDDV